MRNQVLAVILFSLIQYNSAQACDFTRIPQSCEDVVCWVAKLGKTGARLYAIALGASPEQLEQAKACLRK